MQGFESFIKNSGLRKFGLALAWIIVSAYLLIQGVLGMDEYMQIQKVLIMAVFGANICEHFTKKKEPTDKKPDEKSG